MEETFAPGTSLSKVPFFHYLAGSAPTGFTVAQVLTRNQNNFKAVVIVQPWFAFQFLFCVVTSLNPVAWFI